MPKKEEEPVELILLCKRDSDDWEKLDTPFFDEIDEVLEWLHDEIDLEFLDNEDEYFVASKMTPETFKKKLKKKKRKRR